VQTWPAWPAVATDGRVIGRASASGGSNFVPSPVCSSCQGPGGPDQGPPGPSHPWTYRGL